MPSAEQVQMQMVDRLSAVFANVDHHPIACRKLLFARDLSDRPQQMAKQRAVFRSGLRQRSDVLARNHQQMHGRLRMNVRKSDALLIFIDAG